MNRRVGSAVAVFMTLAVVAAAGDKPAKEPESYARIELKGKLVDFKGSPQFVQEGLSGLYIHVQGDLFLGGPPTWELDLGDDKQLVTVASKLIGKAARVRGDVQTKWEGGLNSPARRRIIVKVASLEAAEDKK